MADVIDKVPKIAYKRPQPKGGSRRGKPNKTTAEIKSMIEGALNDAGGQKYLAQQARDNPAAFLSLLGKILPRDVNLGGQQNNPVKHTVEIIRTFIAADAADANKAQDS